jgi:hypothetical protein
MASTSATTATSSFAALLKQSKFASYSPAIAQAYVTHGGHAARGDWGVKRPLSVRKRNRALLIQSMDSREQQTEFRSAEPEAKMIQRWEETGVDVTPANKGGDMAWVHQYDANRPIGDVGIDSEYCTFTTEKDVSAGPASGLPALGVKTPPSIEATPNFYTMNKKDFARYLERVRKMRPAFRRYIQEIQARLQKGEDEVNELPHLFRIRHENRFDDFAHGFLNEMAHELHGSSESQALEPYPHRNGGLFYPSSNTFQTSLLYPSMPARYTSKVPAGGHLVNVAGIVATVKFGNNEDYTTLDWSRQGDTRTESRFDNEHPQVRFLTAQLIKPPQTVATSGNATGKLSYSAPPASILRHKNPDLTTPPFAYPAGINTLTMAVDAATVRNQSARSNPYRPGSIPYSFSMAMRNPAKLKVGPRPPPALSNASATGIYAGRNKTKWSRKNPHMVENLNALLSRMGGEETKE